MRSSPWQGGKRRQAEGWQAQAGTGQLPGRNPPRPTRGAAARQKHRRTVQGRFLWRRPPHKRRGRGKGSCGARI